MVCGFKGEAESVGGINYAAIYLQHWHGNKWITVDSTTTCRGSPMDRDGYYWFIRYNVSAGTHYYRTVYNGDAQYAPSVSNEVEVNGSG